MKAIVQTFRNPIFSLMQSALHDTLQRREPVSVRLSADHPAMQQFVAAAKNKLSSPPTVISTTLPISSSIPVLSCAEMLVEITYAEFTGNKTRRDALYNELKFSTCDPLWAECVATYLLWQAGNAPIPYVTYDDLNDFVIPFPKSKNPNGLVIGVVADWGTGMEDANWLLGRLLSYKVDLIIHLGDIYYSATTDEVAENFLNVINATGFSGPIFSLSGNHDMYSGGIGYYGLLQQIRQPASYFCLRNNDWQILAMDTGYHDSDPSNVSTNLTYLEPQEITWHLDKINNAGGRKTILVSHHQPFSPFGDGIGKDSSTGKYLVTNPNLYNPFQQILKNVSLWLFGHEHSCNLFQPYNDITRGRCIGAGAVPELDSTAYTINKTLDTGPVGSFPQLINDSESGKPITLRQNSDGEFYHCFSILRLGTGSANSLAEYYQLDSANNGQETLMFFENL